MKPPPRNRDGERESDRDGGVDRVAAALQDVEPDARRRCFLGHDHAMPGHHRTRRGERGDDGRLIGDGSGRDEAEKSEGELERSQSVVLTT